MAAIDTERQPPNNEGMPAVQNLLEMRTSVSKNKMDRLENCRLHRHAEQKLERGEVTMQR